MCTSLEEEHEALLQFLYMAPIGLLQADADGEIQMINALCAQLLMPVAADGQMANLFDVFRNLVPDLAQRAAACDQPHGKIVEGMQIPVYAAALGRRGTQVLSLTLLKLDDCRLMAVLNDVTELVQRERELRHSQAWIDSIVTGLVDYALVELDSRGAVRSWNESIGRLTGFDAAAVCGQPFTVFYPAEAVPPTLVQDLLGEALGSGWCLDEGWRCRADGSRFWGSCLIAPLQPDAQGPDDQGFSLIVRDIHDRREAHQALRSAVFNDHLTGLANRRAFHELGTQEVRRWQQQARPLSLLLIDADHFKGINDQHGHATGDAVLRHLAAALGAGLRNLDTVARLGGEEFVALLPGSTADGAEALAARLCESIAAQPVLVNGAPVHTTVSIGVATMETGVVDLEALLARADQAMYAAKRQGRNRAVRWSAELAAPVPA
jgi:diguanylate cyclase (GGDEF)-like protein/PAS domain S-box-containing protein